MNIVDNISADTIEPGDQILIDGDPVEVKSIGESDNVDEVVVKGYSHTTGDLEVFILNADDYFDVWFV